MLRRLVIFLALMLLAGCQTQSETLSRELIVTLLKPEPYPAVLPAENLAECFNEWKLDQNEVTVFSARYQPEATIRFNNMLIRSYSPAAKRAAGRARIYDVKIQREFGSFRKRMISQSLLCVEDGDSGNLTHIVAFFMSEKGKVLRDRLDVSVIKFWTTLNGGARDETLKPL